MSDISETPNPPFLLKAKSGKTNYAEAKVISAIEAVGFARFVDELIKPSAATLEVLARFAAQPGIAYSDYERIMRLIDAVRRP